MSKQLRDRFSPKDAPKLNSWMALDDGDSPTTKELRPGFYVPGKAENSSYTGDALLSMATDELSREDKLEALRDRVVEVSAD